MKIGVNLYSIRNSIQTNKDLTTTLFALKKAGCDFVQFSGSPVPLTSLKEISKKTKMPIVLTHSPYNRIVNDLENLIKEHKEFNCRNIGLGSMPDKKIYNNENNIKKIINKLENVAKKMNKYDMQFYYHHHHQEFIKLKEGITILEYMAKKAPHINFTLDTYWVQYGGAAIIDTIHLLKGRIGCVHLKDYKINKDFIPEFAPLGDGTMNFKAIISECKKAGTKYFLIEQDNAAQIEDGFKDIIKSIKYIKENF